MGIFAKKVVEAIGAPGNYPPITLPVLPKRLEKVHKTEYDAKILELPPGYDPAKCIKVSATQLKSFAGTRESCNRQWWLRYGLGYPIVDTDAQVFGTTLHSVCERFLLADDLGRNEDGTPVELYPAGWDARITPLEAESIKTLITTAIEEGILARFADRRIEHGFIRHLCDVDGIHVFVQGHIDLLLPSAVHDHKTTSSMDYAKSQKALAADTQMLLYAREALVLAEQESDGAPETVTLRHNYYCKNKKDGELRVKKVEVEVSAQEVLEHWERMKVRAADMVRTLLRFPTADRWHEVNGPEEFAAACNAYKGCSFRPICGGRESPENYRVRVERVIRNTIQPTESQETRKMATPQTFAEKLAAAKNGKAPPAKAPGTQTVNGTVTKSATPPPAPPKPPAKPAAPTPPPAPPAPEPEAPTEKLYWIEAPEESKEGPTLKPLSWIEAYCSNKGEDCLVCPEGANEWIEVSKVLGLEESVPAAEPSETPAAEEPAAPTQDAPPWHDPNCKACVKTPGFNSKGRPCGLCDTKATVRSDGTSSGNYELKKGDDGKVTWTKLDFGSTKPAKGAKAEGSAPAATAPTPPAAPAAPAAEEPEAPEPPAASVAEQAKRGPGRPKKGFTLLLGCVPSKGVDAKNVHHISDIFARYGGALAKNSGAESFYDLKPFERADRLARHAGDIAEEVGTGYVVVPAGGAASYDVKALVEALAPFAGMVIQGSAS